MTKSGDNIYKTSRILSGMSAEEAAPKLFISERTLSRIENNHLDPPTNLVRRMSKLYQDPWLAIEHLRDTNEIARDFLPEDIERQELSMAVLGKLQSISDLVNTQQSLISMAKDGKITEDEREEWERAKETVKKAIGSGVVLVYSCA